jgi:predicted DNA-binding transcriptional regulator AlpA
MDMALLYDAGPIEGVDFVRLLPEELVAPAAKQVADRLTVSVGCLRAWRIRGKGPPTIRVGSALRWDEREVDAWLNARRESGGLAS